MKAVGNHNGKVRLAFVLDGAGVAPPVVVVSLAIGPFKILTCVAQLLPGGGPTCRADVVYGIDDGRFVGADFGDHPGIAAALGSVVAKGHDAEADAFGVADNI